MNIEQIALDLYTPPFKYQYGYIFDSADNVFADINGGADDNIQGDEEGSLALRVRGWGRINT